MIVYWRILCMQTSRTCTPGVLNHKSIPAFFTLTYGILIILVGRIRSQFRINLEKKMNQGNLRFSRNGVALILLVMLIISISASVTLASSSNLVEQLEFVPASANDDVTCVDGIINGGFENSTVWVITATEYTAKYVTDPEPVHSGDWSVRTGIVNPADNRYSYSSVRQIVPIPSGTEFIKLNFWIYPQTSESESIPLKLPENPLSIDKEDAANVSDWQFVFILDRSGQELKRLIYRRQNVDAWEFHSFDISDLKNQGAIQVYFDTFNNGVDGITSMHVDDVSLDLCDGPPTQDLYGSIEGSVVLQGRSDHSGAQVCADNGSLIYCTQTDAAGAYSLDVLGGSYDVTVAKELYLNAEKQNVAVPAATTAILNPVTLLGGDTNNDCDVNILDLSFVGGRFGLSCGDTNWDDRADINIDCTINILDLSLLGGNFGNSCPVRWN